MNIKPVPIPLPSRANQARRALWMLVWCLLYRTSPTPLHAWRRFLLRAFGARVGPHAHPYPAARIWAPWNLLMEEGACLANKSDCYNVAPVRLGRYAVVSQGAFLCTASHAIDRPGFELTAAPIAIHAGAWVAAAAYIGPGVTMHERAVVGACAVVTKDVAAGDVVAGNPARLVARRHLADVAPI